MGLHSVDAEDAGYNLTGSPFGSSEQYLRKQRTRWDIDNDKFYNDLGIEFAECLKVNPNCKPSEILNSGKHDERKMNLGLGLPKAQGWRSFNPDNEAPRASLRKPEDRVKLEIPYEAMNEIEYAIAARDAKRIKQNLSLIRSICENGAISDRNRKFDDAPDYNIADATDRYCRVYNQTMRTVTHELYIEGQKRNTRLGK